MSYTKALSIFNERIRIDSFYGNGEKLVKMMDKLAIKMEASKQIIQVRREQLSSFIRVGYMIEAIV